MPHSEGSRRFRRAKLGPQSVDMASLIEARDQARQAAAEAAATVAQLRTMGTSFARIALTVLARASLIGSFPWAEKLALRDQLVSQLRELGVTTDDIVDAERTLRALVRYRLGWSVLNAAEAMCRDQHGPYSDEVTSLSGDLRAQFNFAEGRLPSSQDLRARVHNYASPEVEELLAELEFFEATGQIRNIGLLDKKEH